MWYWEGVGSRSRPWRIGDRRKKEVGPPRSDDNMEMRVEITIMRMMHFKNN